MPKRPCAVALSVDDSMIISADKFGDVYSLPLLPDPVSKVPQGSPETSIKNPASTSVRAFVPAANDLTVHSIRNRKALQNQLRQTNQPAEKIGPTFEHTLLLGHVSMLTEIVVVEHENHSYILTADRDEHIRISRGIPQAHVIEAYCLGHNEFVSRMCFPSPHSELLISGGGDDEIYLWDWLSGSLLHKVDLRTHVEALTAADSRTSDAVDQGVSPEKQKIAVSNICYAAPSDGDNGIVTLTCEGIPALFCFALVGHSTLTHSQTIPLGGNPLDLLVVGPGKHLIVSTDYVHEAGSTTRIKESLDMNAESLRMLRLEGSAWFERVISFQTPRDDSASNRASSFECMSLGLSNKLYNLETLRKRGPEED